MAKSGWRRTNRSKGLIRRRPPHAPSPIGLDTSGLMRPSFCEKTVHIRIASLEAQFAIQRIRGLARRPARQIDRSRAASTRFFNCGVRQGSTKSEPPRRSIHDDVLDPRSLTARDGEQDQRQSPNDHPITLGDEEDDVTIRGQSDDVVVSKWRRARRQLRHEPIERVSQLRRRRLDDRHLDTHDSARHTGLRRSS